MLSSSKGHVKNEKGQTKHECKSATFHDFTNLYICVYLIHTFVRLVHHSYAYICASYARRYASYAHKCASHAERRCIIYTHLIVICTQMCIMCTQRQESVNARLLVPLAPAEKSLWSAHADFLCAG